MWRWRALARAPALLSVGGPIYLCFYTRSNNVAKTILPDYFKNIFFCIHDLTYKVDNRSGHRRRCRGRLLKLESKAFLEHIELDGTVEGIEFMQNYYREAQPRAGDMYTAMPWM